MHQFRDKVSINNLEVQNHNKEHAYKFIKYKKAIYLLKQINIKNLQKDKEKQYVINLFKENTYSMQDYIRKLSNKRDFY